MSSGVIAMMLGISVLLGFIALGALLWGIKNKQFEDYTKFLDGTKYDSQEALNDAVKMEEKKKQALKEKKQERAEGGGYRPPD